MLLRMDLGAKRLIRLVEDLLRYVQIESGATQLEVDRYRTCAELNSIISGVIGTYSLRAQERNIRLEMQVPTDLTASVVPTHLGDAVGRLVDNAIKFSKLQGGHVLIQATRQEDEIRISVHDEGIGIDRAQQQRLFKRFEQLDRESMEQQGLGLGLAIAHALVRLQGGNITVASEPNQGSTFTITLPAGE